MKSRSKEARYLAAALRNQQNSVANDSYSNIPARLGMGTNNQAEAGMYPLTRITRNYMLMLALYRSHWIVRRIVDCVSEDMLKNAPTLTCDLKPEQIKKFDRVLRETATLDSLITGEKWGRLFGGGGVCRLLLNNRFNS